MGLIALDIPPGVYRNGTNFQAQGRYYDADLIRFHEGAVRPIGGWTTLSQTALTGKARALMAWLDNANQAWVAVGTHSNLYAMTRNGAVSDITPAGFVTGRADATVGSGYGSGLYGAGLYGTPRVSSTNIIPASVWSLDTFGEYLMGTMGDTIYEWLLDTGTPAVATTGAPEAEAILVTDERIVMALGSDGDPRAVDWSDAEDRTDWTPTSTNLAGGKRLQTNGRLRCGRKVRGGNLILTDVDVHLATYVGLPFVYSFDRLATGCGAVSKGALVAVDAEAYWMGDNSFWCYNGLVSEVPCDVSDYVFSDINRTQISKVSVWHNSLWGEVTWHYPSGDSIEVDRYVSLKYRGNDRHWNIGRLVRLAGTDRGVLPNPLLVGDDGYVYRHEIGDLKDGRQPVLVSGPVELGEGDRTMEVYGYIPDTINTGDVSLTLSTRDRPGDAASTYGPYSTTAKTDLRLSGRSVAVTLTGPADADFRIGRDKFDVKAGSPR